MKTRIATVTAALACLALGCNQQTGQPVADSQPDFSNNEPSGEPRVAPQVTLQATASQFESPASVTSPTDVISSFLTALRDGDEQTTAALLTSLARAETSRRNLTVRPPGAPSAEFKIGNVEYIGPQQDGAHVTSTWTEDDDAGNRIAYEVVWVMRHQTEGWRIAGLAANLTAGEPPVFLNFENPDEMIAKQQRAEQIAAEYDKNPPIQQARQPQPAVKTYR